MALKEHTKKVWIVVLYSLSTGERWGHSQFYSKRGLAVNWANRNTRGISRAEVLEYSLSDPVITYSAPEKA